jgi:hypothetical protein
MFKNAAIATILGLSFMAGCAADTGSQSRDLATGDFVTQDQSCYRVVGDYDGDVTPPPINISIGDLDLSAPDTMVEAQSYDGPYARLLGEFVAVQVNIDAGAEISSDDIDVLIRAEDMLAAVDAEANPERFQATADQLTELIAEVAGINQGMRIEVPCMDASNEGVFEVDTPLPERDSKRMHERILGASAEASAPSSDGNGFYRPGSRPLPHRPYRR